MGKYLPGMRKYKQAECGFCHNVKFIAAHGLCRACFSRERLNGTPDYKPKRVRATCSEPGCDERVVSFGKCERHRSRYKRKTDPRMVSVQTGTTEELKAKFLLRKDSNLRRDFGITLAQYDSKFAEQNGVCAICGQPDKRVHKATKLPMNLAVDHCHNSKKIRGLLCSNCNTGLGNFKDDPNILRAAVAYLEQHEAWTDSEIEGLKKDLFESGRMTKEEIAFAVLENIRHEHDEDTKLNKFRELAKGMTVKAVIPKFKPNEV